MIGTKFSFFTPDQIELLKERVFLLLGEFGVKLDPHEEMFDLLSKAGARVDRSTGMVCFPKAVLEKALEQTPRKFILGARNTQQVLPLPRPDGTFYARIGTGAHGWIEPETGEYRKLRKADLETIARMTNRLDEISFLSFLFCGDVPVETADIHGLCSVLKYSDKHIWVQPYSAGSIEYLIKLGAIVAGGEASLRENPLISMIACSLAPKAFKYMDIEIILQSAKAGLPIQACSLPGAGGTGPATLPGVVLLASAEILAMLAMAQAVAPGTPIVACPIIFSTDMRTGRSLQSSVEAFKAASGAVQFLKAAFDLPTHNYGSGSDAPNVDGQSMSERAMLTMLMGLSGLDILGGVGQLEVATAISPLQMIVDNEVLAMTRRLLGGFTFDEDQLAWDVLTQTEPGQHFMLSGHTLAHCRDGYNPQLFLRLPRDTWVRQGCPDLMERALKHYKELVAKEDSAALDNDTAAKLDDLVSIADDRLRAAEAATS